jgi:hypothetical protein
MMKFSKILTKAISLIMAFAMIAVMSPLTVTAEETKWEVNKSKTATELDENDQTTVTLSLPAAEITKATADVVFVMDHSGYADIKDIATAVTTLLGSLKAKQNLTVNIGVISFDSWGVDAISQFTDGKSSGMVTLNDANYETILGAIQSGARLYLGGSNTEQPIRMANAMLASDKDENTSKYMVVLSDFLTYVYEGSATVTNDDKTTTTYDHIPVGSAIAGNDMSVLEEWTKVPEYQTWASMKSIYDANNKTLPGSDWNEDAMFFRYGSYSQYSWINYRANGGGAYDTTPTKEWELQTQAQYNANAQTVRNNTASEKHVAGYQRSALLTYDAMESAINSGTHVIAYDNATAAWHKEMGNFQTDMLSSIAKKGASVYQSTNENTTIANAFNDLEAQVMYLINNGSVTDTIGSGFDLIAGSGKCPFKLMVGGKDLEANSIATNEWAFGEKDAKTGLYPYTVKYTAGNDEQFVWTINVPVEKAKQTQLSYTLQLNTKKNGTYKTNGPTILNYTDSNGIAHDAENFTSPTVTRNVAEPTPTPTVVPTAAPTATPTIKPQPTETPSNNSNDTYVAPDTSCRK